MMICASRRTDIPAFQSEWFMSRLRAGSIAVRNPVVRDVIRTYDITPKNVNCIMFMSKNPKPMIKHIDEIKGMGYDIIFQVTITPYGQDIEGNVPDKTKVIESFNRISDKIGAERTIWRYDPILMNKDFTIERHIDIFEDYCDIIRTRRCVFSFVDDFPKLKGALQRNGIRAPDTEECKLFVSAAKEITASKGIDLISCCEDTDVEKGCVNERYMRSLGIGYEKASPYREGCGCVKCIDIGTYATCDHRCVYCYANIV